MPYVSTDWESFEFRSVLPTLGCRNCTDLQVTKGRPMRVDSDEKSWELVSLGHHCQSLAHY